MAKANTEFFEAVRLLEKEKGISADYLLEKIQAAIYLAVEKNFSVAKENVRIVMDPENNIFTVALVKTVVEEINDPYTEVLPEQAGKRKKAAKVGDIVEIPLETKQFGRIAADAAKQVIRQGIREAEHGNQIQEFERKNQELVTALVVRVDQETGDVVLEIGQNRAALRRADQLPNDNFKEGERITVFVYNIFKGEKSARMLVSRTHPGLVKRLFEKEVPEIFNGTVEVKAIARDAGFRTKIAVYATDENVDPVGACIGPHGSRVAGIVDALGGEKIDIVRYNEDPATFIAAALSPAKVVRVTPDPTVDKKYQVAVPEDQLSLAIGNKGQNARLAAHLTGCKIDIHPESGFFGEDSNA